MSDYIYCWQFFQENLITIQPQDAALPGCFEAIAGQLNAVLLLCKNIFDEPKVSSLCLNTNRTINYFEIEGSLSKNMQVSLFQALCEQCFSSQVPTTMPTSPGAPTAAPTLDDITTKAPITSSKHVSSAEIVGVLFAAVFIAAVAVSAGRWLYKKRQDYNLTRYESLPQ